MTESFSELPEDVLAEWRALHAEAAQAYADLAPKRFSRRVLVGIAAGVILLLLGAFWGADRFYQRIEATRQAVAAVTQDAFATSSYETAAAQAAASTAIADAANQTATVQAIERASVDATATAVAVAGECNARAQYALTVADRPELSPARGTQYVVGSAEPAIYAVWQVTNMGRCPWNVGPDAAEETGSVVVVRVEGLEPVEAEFRAEGGDMWVDPGETVEVVLGFTLAQAEGEIEGEWMFQIRGFFLNDQDHLRLNVSGWVVRVTPTPRPSPTPTDVPPTFTSTPVTVRPGRPTDTPTPVTPTNTSIPAPITVEPGRPTVTPTPRPADTPTHTPMPITSTPIMPTSTVCP
ncbi:MAG: hypothetical protein JXD18_13045 [Anaerolineae bacterium]|nr:hypothetical protein [Anaerolineae bacterium]